MKSRIARGAIMLLALGPAAVVGSGCSNATEGAVSGAGIGALSGLAIGSLSGNAGAGAAVGAVVGGVGGAVIGDQNRRREEEAAAARSSQQPQPAPQPAPTQTVAVAQPASTTVVVVNGSTRQYSTGEALGRLIGKWQINGTIDGGDGKTLKVSGTATGSIERTYFVRLDTRFTDPRSGQAVEGTTMISQTGGKGIELTNSFSTSPEMKHFKGSVDQSGTIYNLTQSDPPNASRRLNVRTAADRTWTAEVWDGNQRLESYTFSPG
jgi:hypothetical protein